MVKLSAVVVRGILSPVQLLIYSPEIVGSRSSSSRSPVRPVTQPGLSAVAVGRVRIAGREESLLLG